MADPDSDGGVDLDGLMWGNLGEDLDYMPAVCLCAQQQALAVHIVAAFSTNA